MITQIETNKKAVAVATAFLFVSIYKYLELVLGEHKHPQKCRDVDRRNRVYGIL